MTGAGPSVDQFVSVRSDYVLYRQPGGGYLRSTAGGVAGSGVWLLTPLAEEVLLLCDGSRTVRDLLAEAHGRFEGAGFSVAASAADLVAEALAQGVLTLAPAPCRAPVIVRGSRTVYRPSHMSIELTDGCNLRCRHCYRDSGPELRQRLPTDRLLTILDEMVDSGVKTVELTGGEPTFHPRFDRILERCVELFDVTAVLTNGTLLTMDRVDRLARAGDRVVVQLDLDGCTAEQHEGLRGLPGSFDRALEGLRRLAERGVAVRVAMTVYPGNWRSVEETFHLAIDAGARWFACNPIIDVGRATPDLVLDEEQLLAVLQVVEGLAAEYPGRAVTGAEVERAAAGLGGNCGAGSRALVLDATGRLRPCILIDEGGPVFGDVGSRPFEECVRQGPLEAFSSMPTPSRETCGSCRYLALCQGCVLRPVLAWERARAAGEPLHCAWNDEVGLERVLAIPG